MIKLGSQEVTKVMKGTEEVSAVYKGTDEVWTSEEPFGEWGYYAPSRGDTYWTNVNTNNKWPLDEFTVETWFKATGAAQGNYASIFGYWTNTGWMFGYNMNLDEDTNNQLALMHVGYSDTYQYQPVATNTLTGWNHVAMVKQGIDIWFYINGQRARSSIPAESYQWGNQRWIYGCGSGIRSGAAGTYSNFRLSSIARYPNGTAFKVPSKPFEPDQYTTVLSHCGPENGKDYSVHNHTGDAGRGAPTTDSPWTPENSMSLKEYADIKVERAKDKLKAKGENKDDG